MTMKRKALDPNALLRAAAGGVSYRVHDDQPEPEPEPKGTRDAAAGTGRQVDPVPPPPDVNELLRAAIGSSRR